LFSLSFLVHRCQKNIYLERGEPDASGRRKAFSYGEFCFYYAMQPGGNGHRRRRPSSSRTSASNGIKLNKRGDVVTGSSINYTVNGGRNKGCQCHSQLPDEQSLIFAECPIKKGKEFMVRLPFCCFRYRSITLLLFSL
jgi:hypothetical protein